MLKLLGLIVLVGAAFGMGYYVGQHPIADLKHAVADVSRHLLDTTLGVERDLRMKQDLTEAKARLIQAKAEVLDRNYGNAAKALSHAIADLDNAAMAGPESQQDKVKALGRKLQEVQSDLSVGKGKIRGRLEEIQTELNALL